MIDLATHWFEIKQYDDKKSICTAWKRSKMYWQMAGMLGGLGGRNKSSVNSKDCNVQLA
jgi:hypothetical protein